MVKVELSADELASKLGPQLRLLKHSIESFPEVPETALDIATRLRVLCHDTRRY